MLYREVAVMDEAEMGAEQRNLDVARAQLAEIEEFLFKHTDVNPDDSENAFKDLLANVIYPREQDLDLGLMEIEEEKEREHERIERGIQMLGIETI